MSNYKVFTRNWWKENNEKDENGQLVWSDGLEPDSRASKKTLGYAETEEEARKMCQEWNKNNKQNRLGRMAEFTQSF